MRITRGRGIPRTPATSSAGRSVDRRHLRPVFRRRLVPRGADAPPLLTSRVAPDKGYTAPRCSAIGQADPPPADRESRRIVNQRATPPISGQSLVPDV